MKPCSISDLAAAAAGVIQRGTWSLWLVDMKTRWALTWFHSRTGGGFSPFGMELESGSAARNLLNRVQE